MSNLICWILTLTLFHWVLVAWTVPLCFRAVPTGGVPLSFVNLFRGMWSNRFCGVRLLDQSGQSILLVCVYFPTDYHTSTSIDELHHTLGELEGFIDSQSFDHLIIGGDFNVDFDRPGSSLAVDLQYRSSVNFTHEKDDHSARSWVDHFLCNSQLTHKFSDIHVLNLGSNLSDHYSLSGLLQFDCARCTVGSSSTRAGQSGIAWHRVKESQLTNYRLKVSLDLPDFPTEVSDCNDPNCNNHSALLLSTICWLSFWVC